MDRKNYFAYRREVDFRAPRKKISLPEIFRSILMNEVL
jgi:hypothetical protein